MLVCKWGIAMVFSSHGLNCVQIENVLIRSQDVKQTYLLLLLLGGENTGQCVRENLLHTQKAFPKFDSQHQTDR